MIKFVVIEAIRRLPAEFANDARTEICECRGFLLASRPGSESLVWRVEGGGLRGNRRATTRIARTWEAVSAARRLDGSLPSYRRLDDYGFERFVPNSRGSGADRVGSALRSGSGQAVGVADEERVV